MKKLILLLLIMMLTCCNAVADEIEIATGLKKLDGERFISDMKYNSEDNFLMKNVYKDFGIEYIYVHKALYEKLKALEPVLKQKNIKLVIFDAYRPPEVQKAMWEILPNSRYVANPKTGSLHNRGVAIDVALAGEDGNYLKFPTEFDSFEAKAAHSYECTTEEQYKCENRALLKSLMESIGLTALNTEWWHYQLPNAKEYPILSVYEKESANEK